MSGAVLARMAMTGMGPDAISGALPPDAHGLRAQVQAHRDALQRLASLASHIAQAHAPCPDAQRAAFDAIAAQAPELGCAAYALDDAALLANATAEVVAWLHAQNLSRGHAVDIGCGTGRFARALTNAGCVVDAYDVSINMLAAARAQGGTARYHVSHGVVTPPRCDLALFADSMPYLVLAGIADRQMAAVARALRPGGAVVVLNLSYRDNPDADRAHAREWAAAYGWTMAHARPFVSWDAQAWIFHRPPAQSQPCHQ